MNFVFCLFIVAVFASGLRQSEFDLYLARSNKIYSGAEYRYRLNIFSQNVAKIEEHNAKNLPWKEGINKFTDLTAEEFAGKFCGCAAPMKKSVGTYVPDLSDVPESVDWRKEGAVTGVKNQGACGSCWAFSTVGTVETSNFIHTKNLVSYSEQQLVDCSKDPYVTHGCAGGWPWSAMEYVKEVGLCTEESYPYTGFDDSCNSDKCEKVVKVKTIEQIEAGREDYLAAAVAKTAVSVVLDATALQSYSSGIITKCSENINHAVLAVGYGEENGTKYWIIKNSWGEDWGEKGYCRVEKDVTDSATGMGRCAITYSSVFASEMQDL